MRRLLARLVSCLLLCLPLAAGAVIVNPAPGTFGPDDGSTTYTPGVDTFFFEAFDALPSIGIPASFGFYRVADPATKITVFDSADQGPPDQLAYANFATGGVIDLDAAAIQSAFAAGFGAIGFYLELIIGGSPLTIYSDPALNAGFDLMAAFPNIGTPGAYLLGVEVPNPTVGDFVTIYFATISGITPAVTVPEPSTLWLTLTVLALAGWFTARSQRLRHSRPRDGAA